MCRTVNNSYCWQKKVYFEILLLKYFTLLIIVNGGYSEWSSFSICTKTGIGGIQKRERFCNNPSHKYGGADCFTLGFSIETRTCGAKPSLGNLVEVVMPEMF